MTVMHLTGRCGLGDNIYWRPLVRAAMQEHEVYVDTPWPELFLDMKGVKLVAPSRTKLRTQQKNIAIHQRRHTFAKPPMDALKVVLKYGWEDLQTSNIFKVMEDQLPLPCEPFVFDLPNFGKSHLVPTDKPLAILRPATERREWLNKARNPDPKYLAQATRILQESGYYVIMIADTERLKEWFAPGPQPVPNASFHRGQLKILQVLSLVQHAAVVVGPVGWIVPATLAFRTPAIIIGGGQGGHNAPERVIDPRMDASRQKWILPDPYCRCVDMLHECVKEIPNFEDRFQEALKVARK